MAIGIPFDHFVCFGSFLLFSPKGAPDQFNQEGCLSVKVLTIVKCTTFYFQVSIHKNQSYVHNLLIVVVKEALHNRLIALYTLDLQCEEFGCLKMTIVSDLEECNY